MAQIDNVSTAQLRRRTGDLAAFAGIQEVVLKSLERNFRAIRGLSGASILGDGRVSLILDVDAIIDMAARNAARRAAPPAAARA